MILILWVIWVSSEAGDALVKAGAPVETLT